MTLFLQGQERRRERRAEAGYNLVVLIVAVTVLNVLVAAMLPLWSTAIRREKEEELVFRGFQYAEAIRVFHQRFQRYPMKLEELIKVKPRCIRQLWKDPMTDDGKWALIFQNGPEGPLQPQAKDDDDDKGRDKARDDKGDQDGQPQLGPRKGEVVQVGPIIGVRSKSGKKSMLILFGRERYDEWTFTETLLLGGGQAVSENGVGVPTPAGTLQFSTRWIGRPMHFLNQPQARPQDGMMPNASPAGPASTKPRSRRTSNLP